MNDAHGWHSVGVSEHQSLLGEWRSHAGQAIASSIGLLSSLSSVMTTSVVSIRPATLAAFCSAVRTTRAGSMMPDLTRSSYSPVVALKPKPLGEGFSLTFS